VPTLNVSAMDLTVQLSRDTRVTEVNAALAEAAATRFDGVLGYTEEPLASCDFNRDSRSSIIDACQTRVSGSAPGQGAHLVRQRVGLRESYAGRGAILVFTVHAGLMRPRNH
jgi:glyceraldehyde-3-phosphate dehydrogenase/erythrose-4-phosphate dehydrogenase